MTEQRSKLSKLAVVYAVLVAAYEVFRIIQYLTQAANEVAAVGGKLSDYVGYLTTSILDTYVIMPLGLIILLLLCAKILNKKPVVQVREKTYGEEVVERFINSGKTEEKDAVEENTADDTAEENQTEDAPATEETTEENAEVAEEKEATTEE